VGNRTNIVHQSFSTSHSLPILLRVI